MWVCQAHRGAPQARVLLCRSARQALQGAPWVGSYSVVQYVRRLMGQPLYCSAANAVVWGEKRLWWLHPLHMTQQYRLASMTAWLSPMGIFHHDLLPHILSICLSTVHSSPHPGIAAQSLTSRPQSLRLPGDLCPYQGYILLWQGLSDSHSI